MILNLIIFIFICYFILISIFIVGYYKVKVLKSNTRKLKTFFTVIIPFRNEERNLPTLINSLLKIEYSKKLFEIIFIDDYSEDNSVEIIENLLFKKQLNFKIISNVRKSNSPKKDAIEIGIKNSMNEWIITTDADCKVPKKWLTNFDNYIQTYNPKMISAPVTFTIKKSILENFQLLDFASLIGVTIGGFGIHKSFLCNGANLCYSKSVFNEVQGFKGDNNISSGDDIFLLEKFQRTYPNNLYFIRKNSSTVYTIPQVSLKKLISQRLRWASKSKFYKNSFGKLVGLMVFLTNLFLIFLLILSIFKPNYLISLIILFLIKLIIDFIVISNTLSLTKQLKHLIYYPIIAILHPFFIVFISFLSIFNTHFDWKGRNYKS